MRKNVLFTVSCFLLFTGCSSYSSFDAAPGYSKYLESPKALSVDEQSPNGSIEISLIMPDECGCYLEKLNDRKEIDDKAAYQCIGFPLYTDDPGKEIKQKAKNNDAKSLGSYVFNSFSEVAIMCVQNQLGDYFNQVEVKLKPTGMEPSQAPSVMSYYAKWGMPDDFYILVKLVAKSSNGDILVASGKTTDKMGNSHAFWYFPVSILTFPIGYIIATSILYSKHDALVNKTIANAIDIAAAELSRKLAESLALNPKQSFEVYVMLE